MKDQDQARGQDVHWWRPISFLFGLLILFFLPLLVGWGKFFYDDIAFVFYPQQVFLARCLGEGVIPWWNPHLCAGASPFYAHIFQSSLSPLNWLFLLWGNLDPARNYFWLIKLPLAVSYLVSAFCSYLFARHGLRIKPAAVFVFSLAYTLSPMMIYLSVCPAEVYILAWLPLFCLCLLRFSENGSWGWLILGAAAFGFISPAGDVPVLLHLLLIAALFGAGLFFLYLRRMDWKSAGRLLAGSIVIFGVGFLLSGIYWANMAVGIRMLASDSQEVVESLSGLPQSMPPAYLVTLFIPDYFGEITSHHTWGAAHHINLSLNDANLLGGLVLSFIVFAGSLCPRRNGSGGGRAAVSRGYWWMFFFLVLFGLFVVLGKYTPVHGFSRRLIPVLRMPYPVRFRTIGCFALAGLLGVSVDLLVRLPPRRPVRAAVIYLIFVFLLAGLTLFPAYTDVRDNVFSPGFRQLTALGDWSWFLTGPVLYFVLGSILILFVSAFKGAKLLVPLLLLLVTAELLFFSYRAFYFNRILNHRYRDIYAARYFGPEDQPIYRKILNWSPERREEKGLYRRLYYRSYFDNLGWLDGSLSMLGFDIKPLDTRFQEMVEGLTEGFPYELRVRDWSSRFWLNMSVRYFLSDRPLSLPWLESMDSPAGNHGYAAAPALPRFYFQDRWREAAPEEESEALLNSDLRLEGRCGSEIISAIPLPEGPGPLKAEGLRRFNMLQAANLVTAFDLSSPNRITLDLEVSIPSMLVITDVWNPDWRVTIDGAESRLYRVNYLQRGVWLSPGDRRVTLEFHPASVSQGLAAFVVGFLLLASGVYYWLARGRKRPSKIQRESG